MEKKVQCREENAYLGEGGNGQNLKEPEWASRVWFQSEIKEKCIVYGV